MSGSPGPTGPSLAPFAEGRVLPGFRTVPALSRLELCGSPLGPGARVGSVARPTLALSAGDNRRQACGPSGRMSVPLRVGQLAFPSLIAVHHARSSSIITLLVLRSFICIWAQLCLVAGRAEASEVEDVRVRCAREVDVCMAHRCYRMRNGMRASPSPGVEPDPHEAAPPGVAM